MSDLPTQPTTPPQAVTLFNKGFSAFERGSYDIAITLMRDALKLAPGYTRARKFLRSAQVARVKKQALPPLVRLLADLAGLPSMFQANILLMAKKNDKALDAAEAMLAVNPLNTGFAKTFVKVATAASLPDAAILTLETLRESTPDPKGRITKQLGLQYLEAQDFAKARDCFAAVMAVNPYDPDALKLLKDTEARNSMRSGGWEDHAGQQDGYRKLMQDQEQAASLDKKAKSQIAGDDAEALIQEARDKIAAEPKNLNFYRALARLYSQNKRFKDAIATLEDAQKVNPADPELDRALSNARVSDYDQRIAELQQSGQADAANELAQERAQFVFDDLSDRVKRYPNDLRLRFELGLIYFNNDYYDEAIQQLQLAQKSPKERVDSLYYLARSFRAKGQPDLATMQLETALDQLQVMDENRKKVLFELGEIAEAAGNIDKAFGYYKEIYGADISFKDVGEKMERIYKLRQAEGGANT